MTDEIIPLFDPACAKAVEETAKATGKVLDLAIEGQSAICRGERASPAGRHAHSTVSSHFA
jgi:hypothetical protein